MCCHSTSAIDHTSFDGAVLCVRLDKEDEPKE